VVASSSGGWLVEEALDKIAEEIVTFSKQNFR